MTNRKQPENLPADLPPVPNELARTPIGLESYALMLWAREVRASYHRQLARAAKAWLVARSRSLIMRFRKSAASRRAEAGEVRSATRS